CLSSPCRNAGKCQTVVRGGSAEYVCTCRLGYTDALCLTPRNNACLSSPCRNGGSCELVNSLQEYKCRCSPGWAGKNCQQADPCASNPCANGGQCVPFEAHYICKCTTGFHGPICKQDINECAVTPPPCRNGGKCLNDIGTYQCTCPPEFTGRHCEKLYIPCSPSPCQNGGTCRSLGDTAYDCACLPGFSGKHCEVNIDDCPAHNCQNRGSCVDGVNTYNCQCPPEWTGQFCTEDVDECQLQPNACQNGGTCHNSNGGYNCVCVNGWTGDDCSENIDDCANAACYSGATCHDRVASFYCECPHGKTGLLCHLDDACISNPCHEGANCDTNPVNGMAICTCPVGYSGAACKQDDDECSLGANPCEHSGKCINTLGSFECLCPLGYHGPRCEMDFNECMSNPCQNEATCLDLIGKFQCICMSGYEGIFCDINSDECASNPCLNNGNCIDKINEFQCECPSGFNGHLCQIDVDECASTPCKNGARCVDGPNKYHCECAEGFEDTHCETDVNECEQDPCHYGTCKDVIANFECLCNPGYTGRVCDININECQSQPCLNGATCQDRVDGYTCSCLKGTEGVNCETNLDDCASNPCEYGNCIDQINSYDCVCEPGYSGQRPMCNVNVDECASNPCRNGGTCKDMINGFSCLCPKGYDDLVCLSEVNECNSNPCIHGVCSDAVNGYKCECDPGWSDTNCNLNINECMSLPCSNGGTCTDMNNGYVCACRLGFRGPNCQTNINECASNPCLNQGSCIDDVAGYKCNCVLPYTGVNCEDVLAPCSEDPCKNGGQCREADDYENFSCVCPEGWQGQTCEKDINECVKSPCQNGATCQNTMGGHSCSCKPGYTGLNCETDIDDCQPNPCHNGGSCSDGVDTFVCACLLGFRGPKCEEDINECASNPCKNGANCTDCVHSYTCTCPPGFSGIHCENNAPDCTESSCFNGGTCVDGINTFSCLCPAGFTGNYCQHDINECDSRPCLNGGTCQDSYGTYKCTCPQGYTGINCQVSNSCPSVDVEQLCRNNGLCLDAGNTHHCRCQAGYTGSYCEEQVNECSPNPCHNAATCTDYLGGYSCQVCPHRTNPALKPLWRWVLTPFLSLSLTGVHCEINVDDCAPFGDPDSHERKCFNKGRCVDRVGGYSCICLAGFVGEHCEGDVNECLSNPCDARGTQNCVQLVNDYKCECRPGYTGHRCDMVFDGCKDRPCRNGGACAVAGNTAYGFICRCPPGYDGATCENKVSQCGALHCPHGSTCVYRHGTTHCLCPTGFTGPECQFPTNSHCEVNPCYNGGTCEPRPTAPYYHCRCPPLFNGLQCFILDYSFVGGEGQDITLPPDQDVSCEVSECAMLAGNRLCDARCNTHACHWDGGDCSLNFNNPWQNCSLSLQCWRYFANNRCDDQCNTPGCLYDGFDCQSLESHCNPLYDQYCRDHYGDGHCDQGCNNMECEWDGLDCANDKPEKLADRTLVVIVLVPPQQLRNESVGFLRELSKLLHTNLKFKKKPEGDDMILPYFGDEEEVDKRHVKRSVGEPAWGTGTDSVWSLYTAITPRARRELEQKEVKGSIVYLEIDNRQCYQTFSECFASATEVAAFLGAMASQGSLQFPYDIEVVKNFSIAPNATLYPMYVVVSALLFLVCIGVGVLVSRKRRREHGQLWFPEGFKVTDSSKKKRREPVGEDSVGLKPLKSSSDGALMDDNQNEHWAEDDPTDNKRFKFDDQTILSDHEDQTDHRQWTQQHLDAADLRIPSMAPTPPQGEIDSDCMDVNVRGPDGFTPLMIASCSGGGLETGNSEEEGDDASGNVISDFIYQGANLHNQTDRTGETALHLAARYARSDAAKRLLEASADANVQDTMGRTPLHAAVAADAQGVFQILIRNRATDLDARMHDGTTPLILAARLAVEGMVEELVNCHADVNAVDDFGKSALHWAAAVNNVEATAVLLKNGANKDMQDNKEETPLFLAGREGSYQTAKILLDHFANREITDHMDRLPRDIAQDRMHHDIVRLLDEYNLVRSPALPGGPTLSPPICSPTAYLGNMKPTAQGKKARKTNGKGLGGGNGKEAKDAKAKRKKSQDGKILLESSAVLSPVDSLESPHAYMSDVASPPLMPSPFQQSPSIQLNHLQGLPSDGHLNVTHLNLSGNQELGLGGGRMTFDSVPPRLSHMSTVGSGGNASIGNPCDWLSRMQAGLVQNQYNPMQSSMPPHAAMHQPGYPGLSNTRLSQPHMMQVQQMQQLGDLGQMDLQQLQILSAQEPQHLQTSLPTSLGQSMTTTQFLTPPSQHSYTSPMDNTPGRHLPAPDHPFLTPSPESPDQWSSSSPHSNMSDWSEGISSPPTSMQSQMGHTPDHVFK
uniref:Neurogenic locus notch homolog protein 1 n=1 Tax=Callorhinchus milii TaxID=7868 RepID=A0A4W3GEJ5_CALMI